MTKIRKAVIPCAGYGTRFLPVTKLIPKELLPIGNKPAIQYVVEEAVAAGIREIILVCNPHKPPIVDYFRSDAALKVFLKSRGKIKEAEELERIESLADFQVVYQEEAKGLGDAVLAAAGAVGGERFAVMLPDVLLFEKSPSLSRLIQVCEAEPESWGLLLEKVSQSRISSYGIVKIEGKDADRLVVQGAVEKPKPEDAPSDLAILGRYLLTPAIFDLIRESAPGCLGELQLTDALNVLCRRAPGLGLVFKETLFDVGNPKGLARANDYLMSLAGRP